jgi:electron transport complex protein RnfD
MNSVLIHSARSAAQQQRQIVLALIPVALSTALVMGLRQIMIIMIACLAGITFEAVGRFLRKLPGRDFHRDLDTVQIALVLGICLSPATPWWLAVCAMGAAVLLFKHAFGGMGQTPFHPALPSLLAFNLAFPEATLNWPVELQFPLLNSESGSTVSSLQGWFWINVTSLITGLYLVFKRHVGWLIPATILVSLALLSYLFHGADIFSAANAILAHFFTGWTMLLVFFVAIYPSSSAHSRLGGMAYGFIIAVSLFTVRSSGTYADGFAIAAVLGSFAAPLLDQLARPQRYGSAASAGMERHNNAMNQRYGRPTIETNP